MTKTKLTESDLAWFSYAAYGSDELGRLGLSGWVSVLSDRIAIKSMLAMNRRDMAAEAMSEIQTAPLKSLGFELPQLAGGAGLDQPTVFLARVGVLKAFAKVAADHKLPDSDQFDLAWAAAEGRTLSGFATIQIDLRAKRSQVRADLETLLLKFDSHVKGPLKRDFTSGTVFEEWIAHEYLPCFDLLLYAEIQEKTIQPALLAKLLRVDDGETDASDLLKAPRRCVQTFTPDVLHAMWRQRDASP